MTPEAMRTRLIWTGTLVVLGSLVLAVRAASVQLKQFDQLPRWAQTQNRIRITIPATRGNIIASNGTELAVSIPAESLWAHPKLIENPKAVAKQLAKILRQDERELHHKLSGSRSFVWLARQLDRQTADRVRALEISGIDFVEESKRSYPHGMLAGPVLGFTGIDSNGLAGIEYAADAILRGRDREVVGERDARGRFFRIGGREPDRSPDGDNIYITIDARIQEIAERELMAAVGRHEAIGGTAVVMDPWTGDILAMASYPGFDPNRYRDYPQERWRNDAIGSVWEPGSTLKTFLIAAALEEGAVAPSTLIDCENGRLEYARRVVFRDDHPREVIPAADVLKFSSNIGSIRIAEKLGKEMHLDYLRRFGFGVRSEIDLPGEERGILGPTSQIRDVQWATIAFGQGISVTPLQVTRAMAAIANGGRLPRPRLLASVRNPAGGIVVGRQPPHLERVISSRTAETMTRMLETVVEPDGTGALANVAGYTIAGKTGTSQKHDISRRGYSAKARIGSFVGFVPSRDPKLVIFVSIDEPKGVVYGGKTAGPVFRAIAEQTLSLMAVTPTAPVAGALAMQAGVVPASWEGESGAVPRRREPVVHEPDAGEEDGPRLPDFTGMTQRRLIAWGRQNSVEFEIRGSGIVMRQQPPWGTPLEHAGKVTVEMKPPP